MTVLVTGGAGFIGQHLARRLTENVPTSLVALDSMLPQVHQDPAAAIAAFPGRVVVADVADPSAWDRVEEQVREAGGIPGRITAIVHLAAETGTAQSMYEQERYRRVNVVGTRLAGQAAARWGVPIVAVSSRAVYGGGGYSCPEHGERAGARCCPRAAPVASTEQDPHLPVSYYGQTKSDGEAELVRLGAEHAIPVTIVRPQNVIGPGQALHNPYTGVLAAFLARLREGQPVQVYQPGTQTRDFLHVGDLAALLSWALSHPPATGEVRVLNAGTGVRTTLLQLARYAASAAALVAPGRQIPLDPVLVDVTRIGDIEHACADLTRGRALGVPTPTWTTEQAVADFVRWAWSRPGADPAAWDDALAELRRHSD